VYIYIYTYIYIYIHIRIYRYVYINVYIYLYIFDCASILAGKSGPSAQGRYFSRGLGGGAQEQRGHGEE